MTKNNPSSPPPGATLPIIQRLVAVYKIWHEYLSHFTKITRFSLGLKIDSLFLEIIEYTLAASNKSRENKLIYLNKASDKLDLLKFLLQVAWEIRTLDNKKYIALSKDLNEVGRMLGGWQRQTKTPQRSF